MGKLAPILVACEESQAVTIAFREQGFEAYSCDVQPCSGGHPEWHIQRDVRPLLRYKWRAVIAFPECTYLTNAGVRHLHSIPSRNGKLPAVHGELRWWAMYLASDFFRKFLTWDGLVAVENPVPHRYAVQAIGRKYSQLIQPWQFGQGETKATCLWLKGLPPLMPTDIVDGREARVHKMPPSEDRAKLRSKTYPGIAQAMATQWGAYLRTVQ